MPRKENIKKVLVIGSGPIIIGQAAEFDYAGTQACRSLKEEGLEVVLINSNPATIMTDSNIADHVYIEPLNVETVKRKVPGIDKRATFLKVLARGTLNKKLIVDADDYSLDAEKMILLVGGKVLSTAVEEEEDEE